MYLLITGNQIQKHPTCLNYYSIQCSSKGCLFQVFLPRSCLTAYCIICSHPTIKSYVVLSTHSLPVLRSQSSPSFTFSLCSVSIIQGPRRLLTTNILSTALIWNIINNTFPVNYVNIWHCFVVYSSSIHPFFYCSFIQYPSNN